MHSAFQSLRPPAIQGLFSVFVTKFMNHPGKAYSARWRSVESDLAFGRAAFEDLGRHDVGDLVFSFPPPCLNPPNPILL
jgi:hypothetical protein